MCHQPVHPAVNRTAIRCVYYVIDDGIIHHMNAARPLNYRRAVPKRNTSACHLGRNNLLSRHGTGAHTVNLGTIYIQELFEFSPMILVNPQNHAYQRSMRQGVTDRLALAAARHHTLDIRLTILWAFRASMSTHQPGAFIPRES